MVRYSPNLLNKALTIAEILGMEGGVNVSRQGDEECILTLVISVVAASISLSSCDLSEKPGRTCFACSLSNAATEED